MSLPSNSSVAPLPLLQNVQALRGIAVVMVMLGHIIAPKDFPWMEQAWIFFHWWAYAGADIFFVLSGFIISGVDARQASSGTAEAHRRAAVGFLAKRFLRIYPFYWLVLAASALASYWIAIEPGMPRMPWWQVASLMTRFNWLVPPAWTLNFEVYFYAAVFVILLLFPRRFYLGIALMMAFHLALFLFVPQPEEAMLTSALVLEFGLGCGVALLISHGRRAHAGFFLCAGLAYFLLGAGLTSQHGLLPSGLRTLSFGVGSAMILYAAVAAELNGRLIAGRFITTIGDASFSLYLWHKGMFMVLAALFSSASLSALVPHSLGVVLTIAITAVFGIGFYRWVERPWVRAANGWVKDRTQVTAPVSIHQGVA